jgi:hypothetical protein
MSEVQLKYCAHDLMTLASPVESLPNEVLALALEWGTGDWGWIAQVRLTNRRWWSAVALLMETIMLRGELKVDGTWHPTQLPRINRLTLLYFREFPYETVQGIQALDFSDWVEVRDRDVGLLVDQLTLLGSTTTKMCVPPVTSINFHRCGLLTDTVFDYIKRFTELRILDLSRCDRLTDDGVSQVGSLAQLSHLNLGDCSLITDVSLVAIGSGLPSLTQLNLRHCRNITDEGLSHIATLEDLRCLD